MITFGPMPSRRLGMSLGINNIPQQKVCTYSCIYCQVGAKQRYSIARESFYDPWLIHNEVANLLEKLDDKSKPDYLTFVANGEPTLDAKLGNTIRLLKSFNIPIAVITNASLLNDESVANDLMEADWVSVKIDTTEELIWKKLNKPHADLKLDRILQGIVNFAEKYKGLLVTETMLVSNVNDLPENHVRTADFIFKVNPSRVYISIPTRPPSVKTVKPASSEAINHAYQIFINKGLNAELILGFEGTNTGFTGNAADDILNISAVHPLRADTLNELLQKDNATFEVVKQLINEQKIEELTFQSKKFYLRKHQ